jgi:hypothetical protein
MTEPREPFVHEDARRALGWMAAIAILAGAVVLTRSLMGGGDRSDAYYDGAAVGAAVFALVAGFLFRFVQVRNTPPPLRRRALLSPWALVIAAVLVPLAALPEVGGGDDGEQASECDTSPEDTLTGGLPRGYDYGPPPPAAEELSRARPGRRQVRAIMRGGRFVAMVSVHEGGDSDDFDDFRGGALSGIRKAGGNPSTDEIRLGGRDSLLVRAEFPQGPLRYVIARLGCNFMVVTSQDERTTTRFARWIVRNG